MKRAIVCAALGAAMLTGAAAAARAEDGQMRVNLAGLDLNTLAGAKVALARIRWSVGVFCDESAGRQSLEHEAAVSRCVSQMTEKSVDALSAPLVTALLTGRPAPQAQVDLAQK